MSWFKELWVLVRMLFKSKPSEIFKMEHLDIVVMKHFPFRGYRYMMWCGKIITRQEKKAVIERFLNTQNGEWSETHEMIHARQARSEHGDNWLRYYLNYFWHWLKGNPFVHPSQSAYYTNRYEMEAYGNEHQPEYLWYYNRSNLRGKYSIKHRKATYREHRDEWRSYCKTL